MYTEAVSDSPRVLLQAVAHDTTETELARAKAATVSAVLSNLESRAIVAEDIGRQLLTYGERCVSQLEP